jgi:hypothetical protein
VAASQLGHQPLQSATTLQRPVCGVQVWLVQSSQAEHPLASAQ